MSSQFFYAFMAFFAIMNPISNLPAYMALLFLSFQEISFLKYLELQLFLSELLAEY